ncbi:Hypothetical protein, putative [Bodo saltans]|uniref:Uncharacterized protein n=1 Tax=Bodo saltans TaxID=75058 RepID=A0A0S4J9Y3_BODSA|nr:Hypothetical protein, putative [Bodo saltans]|eukprot:CUG86274.1 Hypothetical protein, putative [Bodo saltans]
MNGIYSSGALLPFATHLRGGVQFTRSTPQYHDPNHNEDGDSPSAYDERCMGQISSAAFYSPSTQHTTSSDMNDAQYSNYNKYLGRELGVGGNVHSYDGVRDSLDIFHSSTGTPSATASPGRGWVATVTTSPDEYHDPITPRHAFHQEGHSMLEPTPGMNSQGDTVSTPRCATPTGQSSHESSSAMFSSPPQLRYHPARFQSSPPQSSPQRHDDAGNTWSTPFKERYWREPGHGGITVPSTPDVAAGSPPPAMSATPFGTPVRRLGNTLSPVIGSGQSPQSTPVRGTSAMAASTSVAMQSLKTPGGVHRTIPPVHRKQKSLNASRVLDGSGLVHDPLSQPISFGGSSQLFAALQTTVFQWNPTGVFTLVNAASIVTAVAASHQGSCVHQYAAVGLETGLLHLFKLDSEGGATAQVVDNQFTKRIAAMAIFDDTLYVADEEGILVIMDLAAKFAPPCPRPERGLENTIDNSSPPPARKRRTSTASTRRSTTDAPMDSPIAVPSTPFEGGTSPLPVHLPPSTSRNLNERVDFGCRVHTIEITDDGNHIAVGCQKGLFVLHRTHLAPELLDGSAPVYHVAWASAELLGMGVLVYVRGRKGSVIVIRSLSSGIHLEHNTYWEVFSLRCCRNSPECIVSHGERLDQNGRPMAQPVHVNRDGDDEPPVDEHLVMYDLQGMRLRKTTRLTGHRCPVHCMVLDPTGDVLVTASMDNSIRFWELQVPAEGHLASRGVSPRALFPPHVFPTSGPLRPLFEKFRYRDEEEDSGDQLR